MDMVFGICGILSGVIMASGDLLLDLKGREDREIGKYGLLHSAWSHMEEKRFRGSILLAMVGTPMQLLGHLAMAHRLSLASPVYGRVFFLTSLLGLCGAFFIHTLLCLFPILYKYLEPGHTVEQIDELIHKIYDAVKLPFWIQYFCLVALPGFLIMGAIFSGLLPISRWYCLLTAPVMTVFGLLLRKWKPRVFYDLPGIVMPSLGVGCVGLLAVISML